MHRKKIKIKNLIASIRPPCRNTPPPAASASLSIIFYSKVPQKSFQLTVSTNLLSLSLESTLLKQWPHHFTKRFLICLGACLHAAKSNG